MRWSLATAAWFLPLCAVGCNSLSPFSASSRYQTDTAAHAPADSASKPEKAAAANATSASDNSASDAGHAAQGTAAASTSTRGPDAKAMAEVMAEIQELGVLDHETQSQLLRDLQQADPAYWPQMVQVFRASVNYRKQLAKRHQTENADQAEDHVASKSPRPKRQSGKVAGTDSQVADNLERLPTSGAAKLSEVDPPNGDYPRTDSPDAVEGGVAATSTKQAQRRAGSLANRAVDKRSDRGVKEEPSEKDEQVKPAAFTESNTNANAKKDWKGHLGLAVQSLEAELANNPADANDPTRQATLRLLYVMAGRRDDAIKPISGLPAAQQDFWSKEMYGLNACLDTQHAADMGHRAAEAAPQLREASGRLSELAPLQVRNLNFCTEVLSYGVFKKFEKYEFKAGQELLLYAEVENFIAELTPRGYHTALKTTYEIVDSRGNRIAEQEFPLTEEYCQNPRRDFFVRYFVWLPKQIYNGQYTLQLAIEDTTGHKLGQSTIEFTVKETAK